mgnify:CR=1 FL=1
MYCINFPYYVRFLIPPNLISPTPTQPTLRLPKQDQNLCLAFDKPSGLPSLWVYCPTPVTLPHVLCLFFCSLVSLLCFLSLRGCFSVLHNLLSKCTGAIRSYGFSCAPADITCHCISHTYVLVRLSPPPYLREACGG